METKIISVFEYLVCVNTRKAGEKYGVIIPRFKSRLEFNAYTLYTKGLIQGSELKTEKPVVTRSMGTYSSFLPDAAPGRYVFEVVEDAEYWCLDKLKNPLKMPNNVINFRVEAEEEYSIPSSKKVLICLGQGLYGDQEVSPEFCFESDNEKILKADSTILGLIIED